MSRRIRVLPTIAALLRTGGMIGIITGGVGGGMLLAARRRIHIEGIAAHRRASERNYARQEAERHQPNDDSYYRCSTWPHEVNGTAGNRVGQAPLIRRRRSPAPAGSVCRCLSWCRS